MMICSKKRILLLFVSCVLLVLLFGTSCDSTFEPIKPNEEIVFSMFGTLDLHADTQWVRVMPIGETLVPTDTVKRAEVTLTRVETGETTTLNDSLFTLRNNTKVWNYWTDTPLYPDEKYLLRAETTDGRYSQATVTIPPSLPRPLIDYSIENEEGLVVVPTDDSLVVAETRFLVQELTPFGPAGTVELFFSHLDHLFLTEEGEYRFRVEGEQMIYNELETGFRVLEREVIIATGSSDWPDLSDLTEEEVPITGVTSNVENGSGVVAGIASRRAPLKKCTNDKGELISCNDSN